MVEINQTAPNFELPGTNGDDIRRYRLEDHLEDGAVVLVFYPFDFSPVCADVLCAFRDAEWLVFTEGIDVFGITLDSCYAHQQFIETYNLPFPLLSDPTGKVTADYDLAYDEWEHHRGVPKRALLTIDDTRTVRHKWETDDAYESPSLDALHETVLSLPEVSLQ